LLLTDIRFGGQSEAGVVDRTTGDDPADWPQPETQQEGWESGMVDVSDLSLSELGELAALPADDESPLANSLRRVAEELAGTTEQIAGFNSAL
jgi:FXSXX-COOH protein